MKSLTFETVTNTRWRVLFESIESRVRYQALLKLQLQVVKADTSNRRLLLHDCVEIGKTAVADEFSSLAMLGSGAIATVVMPLSPPRRA